MTKYVIQGEKPKEEVPVNLKTLYSERIIFLVGKWTVFKLNPDGTGELAIGIPRYNKEGLQVDEEGRIKLVD